jgi:hypothetical protein
MWPYLLDRNGDFHYHMYINELIFTLSNKKGVAFEDQISERHNR